MATRRRLSQHFIVEEFDCRDGSPVPKSAVAGLELAIGWWLEPMRQEFGPVRILSGYRSEAYNKLVGGAPDSAHIYSRDRGVANHTGNREIRVIAFDVHCARGGVPQWAAWAHTHRARYPHLAKKGRGGIGVYLQSHFVHLDTWSLRDWQG